MSAPSPGGNEVSLVGSSTLTLAQFRPRPLTDPSSEVCESVVRGHASPTASAIPSRMGTVQTRAMKLRRPVIMMSSKYLDRLHGNRFDRVAHEARAVPVGAIGLG